MTKQEFETISKMLRELEVKIINIFDEKRNELIGDSKLESTCCFAPVNKGGFCTSCGEHDRA